MGHTQSRWGQHKDSYRSLDEVMSSTGTLVFGPVRLESSDLRQRANCAFSEENTRYASRTSIPFLAERYMKGFEVDQDVSHIPSLWRSFLLYILSPDIQKNPTKKLRCLLILSHRSLASPPQTAMRSRWRQRSRTVSSDFIQDEGLRLINITVPTHNKLEAYVNTKSKDDPWSPYTIQNDTSSALSKEYKGR